MSQEGLYPATVKLGLGTVQSGMNYGIANTSGKPASDTVGALLDMAARAGVSLLDTAHSYGDAERVIGSQARFAESFEVVTKTKPVTGSGVDQDQIAAVGSAFDQSAAALRNWTIHAVLVHRAGDLLLPGAERLWDLLQGWKVEGRTRRVGVSVYNPAETRQLLEKFPLDIVQLPLNIYDQRFIQSGILDALKSRGVEIHVRSAFLQGLLLMPSTDLPPHFDAIRAHHARFLAAAEKAAINPLAAALRFCLNQPKVDRVIVGCETVHQLGEILQAAGSDDRSLNSADFAIADEAIINPSRWPAPR